MVGLEVGKAEPEDTVSDSDEIVVEDTSTTMPLSSPLSDASGSEEARDQDDDEEEDEDSSSNRENQDHQSNLQESGAVTTLAAAETKSGDKKESSEVIEENPAATSASASGEVEKGAAPQELYQDQEEEKMNEGAEVPHSHTGLRSECSSKPDPPSILDDSVVLSERFEDDLLDPLDASSSPEDTAAQDGVTTAVREAAELLVDLSDGAMAAKQLPAAAASEREEEEKKTADGYDGPPEVVDSPPASSIAVAHNTHDDEITDQRVQQVVVGRQTASGSSPDPTTSTLGAHDPADHHHHDPILGDPPRVLSPDAPSHDERLSAPVVDAAPAAVEQTAVTAAVPLEQPATPSPRSSSSHSRQQQQQQQQQLQTPTDRGASGGFFRTPPERANSLELSRGSYHSYTMGPPVVGGIAAPSPPPGTVSVSIMQRVPADENIELLPAVDEHRLHGTPVAAPGVMLSSSSHLGVPGLQHQQPPQPSPHQLLQQPVHPQQQPAFPPVAFSTIPPAHHHHPHHVAVRPAAGGRRKIRLRLQEEVVRAATPLAVGREGALKRGLLGSIRRGSRNMFGQHAAAPPPTMDSSNRSHGPITMVDRGTITVSWFEGTGSLELHEHVRKTVIRKLKLEKSKHELVDMRVVDESMDPPEEIVLSPFIPSGSEFLLQFSLHDINDGARTPTSQYSSVRAPVSPSAAPSPYPERKSLLNNLHTNQLALLNLPSSPRRSHNERTIKVEPTRTKEGEIKQVEQQANKEQQPNKEKQQQPQHQPKTTAENVNLDDNDSNEFSDSMEEEDDEMMLHTEDPIEARLRQITELLLSDRQKKPGETSRRRREKRQVVFVLANYFVLFLSFIAISAEIQARAPRWLSKLESHMNDVQDCAADQEALFQCVTNGDFAGLVASVIIWLTRSVATRRIFLFGFDTREKLWTVVYESFVTAFCWGVSYIFIRRGLNPDTRHRFIQKYWKDAVYGSLAGFNAAFLKQVLKNLIPQEAVEEAVQDALRDRPLSILRWLGPSLD